MNIFQKILAISEECPPIEKTNQTDGNKWVSAFDIKAVLNPLLLKHKVASYLHNSRIETYGTNRMVYCTFHYVNTEDVSGEDMIIVNIPYEIGDKDLTGNAITLCSKYADIQTFRILVVEEGDGDKIKAPVSPSDKAADKVVKMGGKRCETGKTVAPQITPLTSIPADIAQAVVDEVAGNLPSDSLACSDIENVASPTPPCVGHDAETVKDEAESIEQIHHEWNKTVLDVKMLGVKVDDCYELKRVNIDMRKLLKKQGKKLTQGIKFELVAAVRLDILPNYLSLEHKYHDYDYDYFTSECMQKFVYTGPDKIELRGVCPTVAERSVKETYDQFFNYLFGLEGVFSNINSFEEYLCAMQMPIGETEKCWEDARDFIKFATFAELDEVITVYYDSLKRL